MSRVYSFLKQGTCVPYSYRQSLRMEKESAKQRTRVEFVRFKSKVHDSPKLDIPPLNNRMLVHAVFRENPKHDRSC